MIPIRTMLATCCAMMALSACQREATQQPDDFAQRIGATQNAAARASSTANAEQIAAEKQAAERDGAVRAPQVSTSTNKGAYADLIVPPSVRLDPKGAAPCRAVAMSPFLNRPDSLQLRESITAANKADGGVRFLPAGSTVTPGERPTRLNVMLDVTNAIRDFRCG